MRILITGGTGDIAQAISYGLLKKGHNVFSPGSKELDVRNEYLIKQHMSFYAPHILINAAGAIHSDEIVGSSTYDWITQIQVNLIGPYLCSKYALENGTEKIINIGSSAGSVGKPGWSAYCASKSGLERLTESLHEEGHYAVCLSIGRTKTKMREKLFGEEDPETLLSPEDVAKAVEDIVNDPGKLSGQIIRYAKNDN